LNLKREKEKNLEGGFMGYRVETLESLSPVYGYDLGDIKQGIMVAKRVGL